MQLQNTVHKSAWILIENGRILSTKSRGKSVFYLPGGKPEANESPENALVREIKEELTVDLVPETINLMGIFEGQAHGRDVGVKVVMTCFTASYQGKLQPANEIAEIAWLQYSDIHNTSPVDQIIFRWLRERGMLD